jgi:hypothetical protein
MSPVAVKLRGVLLAVLVVAAACLMFGCRDAQLGNLPGKYILRAKWGESTLILHLYHTMEQDVRATKGAPRHISGAWQFANDIVTLKPCLEVRWKTEGAPADGCASGVTITAFGKVEISVDSQYSLSYEKITNIQ